MTTIASPDQGSNLRKCSIMFDLDSALLFVVGRFSRQVGKKLTTGLGKMFACVNIAREAIRRGGKRRQTTTCRNGPGSPMHVKGKCRGQVRGVTSWDLSWPNASCSSHSKKIYSRQNPKYGWGAPTAPQFRERTLDRMPALAARMIPRLSGTNDSAAFLGYSDKKF